MARLRIAAAALCTRGTGAAPEVLLARRAPELRFFGGYDAFPGGVLDPEDGVADDEAALAAATLRAAVREVFEETGLLPAGFEDLLVEEERAAVRRGLLAGDTDAAATFRSAVDRTPAVLEALRPLGWLTTPPFAPVRYRTRFLHVPIAAGARPDPCGGEIVQARFERPGEALASWVRGERLIVPPVLWQLRHLEDEGLDAFLEAQPTRCAAHEAGRLHRIRSAPGVWMAALRTPTLPPATTTNTYVVGEERLVVIDPATPEASEQERLFELLDALQAEGRRVERVLVTHHHHDHVGAVQATAERYQVPVAAHPLTLERLPHAPREAQALEDGAQIELGSAPDGSTGWHLEALHTPGHDRGHLAFLESRYRSVFLGDLASTVSTIVIDPPEGHLATYLESLERLERFPMTTLYPAHGPAMRDGRRLAQKYIRHRRQREATLVKTLQEQPCDVDALLPKVYWDADERLYPFAARSLLAGLEKLAEEGRAEQQDGVWRLTP